MKNIVCTALMLLMSVCMYAQELYGELVILVVCIKMCRKKENSEQ